MPLTIVTASTLYTLQGTTAEPGLIYYFRTPRRLSTVMKWISCYMALSRVRSLSELRSIGLTSSIRELIDNGPPEGFLPRFLKIFGDKISYTNEARLVNDSIATSFIVKNRMRWLCKTHLPPVPRLLILLNRMSILLLTDQPA